jgi:hypothetical protein
MPRMIKFQDETVYTKPNYWGKIFMYNNPSWDRLYPFVDIIRILPKTTVIAHKYGKNQDNIRIYGTQYNHSVVGSDLNKRNDYIEDLKCIKFIFIFSDVQDTFADNLIKYCEKSRTNLICYSSLDSVYHFYEYTTTDKIIHKISEPGKVIEKMEEIKEKGTINKLQELFPEFEIIEPEEIKRISTLEKCLIILKDQQQNNKKSVNLLTLPNLKPQDNFIKKEKNTLYSFFKKKD